MARAVGPLTAVGATAHWTAAARAAEREHESSLVDDPWAAELAGEAGMAWLARQAPGATLPMVVRTRFFDDWLMAAAARDHGPRQVVLLGAGLDTRAWRLTWPHGTVVYEVDQASILGAKAAVLADAGAVPACEHVPVPVDLADAWPPLLEEAGFTPAMASLWLAEGLLFYLPDAMVRELLGRVTALTAPGSGLAFDIPNRAVLDSPWTRPWIEMQAAEGAPWRGTMDDPAAELAALGWTAQVTQPGEGDTGHGRWTLPVVPAAARELPHSWYVTAWR